jgi:hypothetical protein
VTISPLADGIQYGRASISLRHLLSRLVSFRQRASKKLGVSSNRKQRTGVIPRFDFIPAVFCGETYPVMTW